MKVYNVLIFAITFIIPGIFTYFTVRIIEFIWLDYSLWLGIYLGIFTFLTFFKDYRHSKNYSIGDNNARVETKIMACVTSFNEDPELVKRTLISVNSAIYNSGDVFLLDDSTDYNISMKLKKFSLSNGVKYIHRVNRSGYKAGAINNALFNYGHNYDLLAIFDADQRPVPDFFERVSHYFNDKIVAFVQVPQSYTEIRSPVAAGAAAQQKPFLHIVMRGRNHISAFSLGSGTVYRIEALLDVGGLEEDTVTEDIATSVLLHEHGWISAYADFFGIWYGEPPTDATAYVKQQGRWSLGGFQLLKPLLKSNLDSGQFTDYLGSYLYWLKSGPIMLMMLIAPIIFLLFRIPFLGINLYMYILLYYPILITTIVIFVYTMRGEAQYNVKSFYLHQCVEMLSFPYVLLSFVNWVTGKKKPFNVTPKGSGRVNLRPVIPQLVICVLEILSVLAGFIWYYSTGDYVLKLAIILNIVWSLYFIVFLAGSIIIAVLSRADVEGGILESWDAA